MNQMLAFLKVVIALLPLVVEGVKIAESVIPVAGSGAQKLEMVKVMLQGAINATAEFGPTFEQLWPTVQGVVSSVVAAYNAAGIFKRA